MKNTLIVLTVLLLSSPVLAQNDLSVVYPRLDSFLQFEKNNHGLLLCINKEEPDYKRFIELYDKQNPSGKRSTKNARTFMDNPEVYSVALPVEISRDARMLYQRYSESLEQSSDALQILGFVGGITAAAFASKKYYYPGLNSESPLGAYLQSTYHQDHRQ